MNMLYQKDQLLENLKEYKKKLFLKNLIKGILFFGLIVLGSFLLFNILEYYGRFNSIIRALFFFTFISIGTYSLVKYFLLPLYHLATIDKQLSDEEAAVQIGQFFPEIKDKLLNVLQLSRTEENTALIKAAIAQKSGDLTVIPFVNAVSMKENNKYLQYIAIPITVFLFIIIFSPSLFSESSSRIVQFNKKFVHQAPFKFIITNSDLIGVFNEDFEINLKLEGTALPQQVYLMSNDRKIKMTKINEQEYQFVFKKIQQSTHFQLEAANFYSDNYELIIERKPSIENFNVELEYPSYLNRPNEKLENSGNLVVPEGTKVLWKLKTVATDKVFVQFDTEKSFHVEQSLFGNHQFSKKIIKNTLFNVFLSGKNPNLKEKIQYTVEVIPDLYPKISAEQFVDSTLYNAITIAGAISDDYGISKLSFYYKITKNNEENRSAYISVPIKSSGFSMSENFYYNWNLDSLKLSPGQSIEYFVRVWDNDKNNGFKSSDSKIFLMKLRSKEEQATDIKNSVAKTESQLDETIKKTSQMQNELEKLQNRLKGKKTFDWQDKKSIEDIIKKHDQIQEEVEKFQRMQNELKLKQDKFTEEDLRIAEKAEQLQKLVDELMDEETKKLYEELQKLLNEKNKEGELQNAIDKIEQKENTLEKELERAMEFFKQLQFEKQLEESIKKLDELSKKEENLSNETKDEKTGTEELKKKQEQLNEEFKELKNELKELDKLNNELENKNDLKQNEQEQESIKEQMDKASEQLSQSQKQKASKNQKSAADKMKEMSQKLSQMKQDMQMKQNAENMEDLRQILENLLTLSFDQEDVMKEFKKVNQSDPKYIKLSQTQLKLKDDAKIIEDSLNALAKRVHQIESFITRELTTMKGYMEESLKGIKQRRTDIAAGKQQLAMTSINNLALLLNDVLKQMRDQQQNMMQGAGSCNKPSPGKGKKPSMSPSQMQQKLNEQMQGLMKNGTSGKQLSEELAKMAAQQARIRKAMQELEKMKGKDGKNGKEGKESGQGNGSMLKEMEKIEEDLVNKRLNPELLKRQKEILTRLLEAENSQRERDTDNKRESNTGKELPRNIPPSLEKYFNEKTKQTELLKTVPPNLNHYYKKEVNEYFEKLGK